MQFSDDGYVPIQLPDGKGGHLPPVDVDPFRLVFQFHAVFDAHKDEPAERYHAALRKVLADAGLPLQDFHSVGLLIRVRDFLHEKATELGEFVPAGSPSQGPVGDTGSSSAAS